MRTSGPGRTCVVMGLLDLNSIAWAIGQAAAGAGFRVVYTFQNEVIKKRFWDRSGGPSGIEHRFCDVTDEAQVKRLFADSQCDLGAVVHSLAYGNPKTCLGEDFHTAPLEDIQKSYEISAVSFALVARHAVPRMAGGGSLVALSFDTRHVYAMYNWMGVHKAALEAIVRALARRHGRDGVRVNAVSAGPLHTMAASKIPGAETVGRVWETCSPLPWDPDTDKAAVGDAVAFLLGPGSRRITGQVLCVDGGVSIMGGPLQPFERER